MGWRDTEAAVSSGELSFVQKEDGFGNAFKNAAKIVAEGMITDAEAAKKAKLEEEKEKRAARRAAEKERKAADAKADKLKRQAKALATDFGADPGNKEAQRYFTEQLYLFDGDSGAVYTKATNDFESGRLSFTTSRSTDEVSSPTAMDQAPPFRLDEGVGIVGATTFESTTGDYTGESRPITSLDLPRLAGRDDKAGDEAQQMIDSGLDPQQLEAGGSKEVETVTQGLGIKSRGELAPDISEYIKAIDVPADMTKQLALIKRDRTLSPKQKEEAKTAIRSYVLQLPKAKTSNDELAKLETEELQSLSALLEAEIGNDPEGKSAGRSQLLKRVNTALTARDEPEEPFDITAFDDDENATIQTKINDPKTPEDQRVQLETLLIERDKNKTFELQPDSPTFIVKYQDAPGEVAVARAVLTKEGQMVNLTTREIVEPIGEVVNVDAQRELAADFSKINTSLIKPLKVARTNMVLAVQSAKNLADIVERSPEVQTTLGGKFPRLLKRIGIEIDAANELFLGGANEREFAAYLDSTLLSENVQGAARDAALYQAELYKFAFTYASSRLGQSGQGLSNKDFQKALEIVAAGTGQTFIDGIKGKVSEIVQIADNAIDIFNEDGSVQIMDVLDTTGRLLSGYRRGSEEYANARGFGEAYAWAKSESQSKRPPKPTSTEGLPTPQSEEERNALPRGWYVSPDGNYKFKE